MAMAEVKVERKRGPNKRLIEMRIKPGKSGGHMIEHHYDHGNGAYHEPEAHMFGRDEGDKAMAHIAKHAKIKHVMPEAEEEQMEEQVAPGIHEKIAKMVED